MKRGDGVVGWCSGTAVLKHRIPYRTDPDPDPAPDPIPFGKEASRRHPMEHADETQQARAADADTEGA